MARGFPHPAATTPAPDEQSIDSLLEQFDRETAQPEPPSELLPDGQQQQNAAQDESIERFLKELNGDTQQADKLQAEVDSLRAAEHQRQELEAFGKYANELQQQMPSHVPADYARAKLEALAHDPVLAAAWDARNVDQKVAQLELQKVQVALYRLQREPMADQARIAELNQYAERLNVAVNSHAILRKATLGILNEAKKLPKPIDEEQTAINMSVAAAVRGASTSTLPKEPPPDFGKMDSQEYRSYVKQHYGYDPGV